MPRPAEPVTVERLPALAVVCVLAVASLFVAFLGATPARVGAEELLGDPRAPGETAFIASHRGGGATAPENTLPAIERALAGGFGYVEIDIALTADRVPVLMHDRTVDRTTDGHGPVASLTLAQVQELDAGSWFDSRFAGTRVPTFAEFLDVLDAAHGRAIVELKGAWDAESVASVAAAIGSHRLERRAAIASFDARTLALMAAASDVIPRLLILGELPDDVVQAAQEAQVRGILADRGDVVRRPDVVDELHDAGIRIAVYTLNKDAQWHAVTALGVDGIVTDAPGSLSDWQRSTADGG